MVIPLARAVAAGRGRAGGRRSAAAGLAPGSRPTRSGRARGAHPRRLLGPPGRRGRLHERHLPGRPRRRLGAGLGAGRALPGARFTGASGTGADWRRWRRWRREEAAGMSRRTLSCARGHRPERVDRLHPPRPDRSGELRAHRGGRRQRGHLQPVHLREGDRRQPRLRRGDQQARPGGQGCREIYGRWSRISSARPTSCGPSSSRKRPDGFVSLEVSPHLAHDTEGTIAEARRLWAACPAERDDQGPGDPRGAARHPAADRRRASTSTSRCSSACRATARSSKPISPGSRTRAAGEPLGRIASVASFFLSRIDVLLDPS